MSEAFVYMFVLGSGASLGVATTVIMMYFLYMKVKNKKPTKKRGSF